MRTMIGIGIAMVGMIGAASPARAQVGAELGAACAIVSGYPFGGGSSSCDPSVSGLGAALAVAGVFAVGRRRRRGK